MSRHSQMAKIRSPGKHRKWKNGRQRAGTRLGNHARNSKPQVPSVVNVDPLGALIHSDSGKLTEKITYVQGGARAHTESC